MPLIARSSLRTSAGRASFSGTHVRSMELVAVNEADVAAVDCVTLEHVRRLQPDLVAQLRVLEWTAASPALPFATSRQTTETTYRALRAALSDIFAAAELTGVRQVLLLGGVDFQPDVTLTRVSELERVAQLRSFPVLA